MTLLVFLALWPQQQPPLAVDAFLGDAFRKVEKDFLSLTRRVTARHILLSHEEVARTLKRKIRDRCIERDRFIVDVFEEAAGKYSLDDTTNLRGGLLGTLVPQGHCRSPQLDKACFEVDLGVLVGPLETDYGYHLLLVTERTNCPKLDGDKTQLLQTRGDDVFGTLVAGNQVGKVDPAKLMVDHGGFWFLTMVAGGLLAELAEKLVTSL